MSVTHPRLAPRRGVARPGSWWSKAWLRSVEETAYSEGDLRRGRALARAGAVGAIEVEVGGFVAAVDDRDDTLTVAGTVEPLAEADLQYLVEVVSAGSGRIAALLSGDLPHALVESLEEVGVELLPYAGELGSTCSCQAWVDPCPHAIAVGVQLGWLLSDDPLVLLHLRGLPRDELLARVHATTVGDRSGADGGPDDADDVDLEAGIDAALRAQVLLDQWDRG